MGMLILEGYGLTETAPLLTINRPGDFKFGTVGKPVAETQIKIDPATGEILARGPQVMKGYLNQPEETAQVIDADGWFHTGDIGELDEIGRVLITDRLKNIIVLANGKNVAPAPMEIALATSKYIAQAVILGDQQPYTGVLIAPGLRGARHLGRRQRPGRDAAGAAGRRRQGRRSCSTPRCERSWTTSRSTSGRAGSRCCRAC